MRPEARIADPGLVDDACRLAAALPCWRGRVYPVPLEGGISNTNFLVEEGGRRWVVRIAGDVEVHGVVRKNEAAASRAAHAAGLAPALRYCGPAALVFEYVEGRTLVPDDIRKPNTLARVVDLVRRCHREVPRHLHGPALFFWVFHAIRDYAHRLRGAAGRDASPIADWLAAAERLERAVGPVELVFGHNDLLAANLIDDGRRLWLIDWEYAGFNSPIFDLGNLASNNEFEVAHRETLLELYFEGRISDAIRLAFAAMTAASLLRETLWSLVSEAHSPVRFDYPAYTARNRSRFEAGFAEFDALERG